MMQSFLPYTLNLGGRLVDLDRPWVMGVMNVTPDSFYAASRVAFDEAAVAARVRTMVEQGADVLDVGACSTRPGSQPPSVEEEMCRLRAVLPVVRREAPQLPVSVDTYRADVARMAVEEFGADIINDVEPSEKMLRMVTRLRVPYIIMSSQPTMHDILLEFAEKVQLLREMGQKDIVLDPGFGFGKTLEGNYEVMDHLEQLLVMELPVLVGISRKSMINRLLGTTPAEALNGTTVLNTIALRKGAAILRVHDVKEAVEAVKIVESLKG